MLVQLVNEQGQEASDPMEVSTEVTPAQLQILCNEILQEVCSKRDASSNAVLRGISVIVCGVCMSAVLACLSVSLSPSPFLHFSLTSSD